MFLDLNLKSKLTVAISKSLKPHPLLSKSNNTSKYVQSNPSEPLWHTQLHFYTISQSNSFAPSSQAPHIESLAMPCLPSAIETLSLRLFGGSSMRNIALINIRFRRSLSVLICLLFWTLRLFLVHLWFHWIN